MKHWHILVALTIAILLPTLSHGQTSQQSEASGLYKSHCAMCHGQDARGNTPVGKVVHIPDLLSPQVQSKSDADLNAVIENGKGKMPAFKTKLKTEEVQDLVAYLRTLPKSEGAKK